MKTITLAILAIVIVIAIPLKGYAQDYQTFCEITFDSDDQSGLYEFCMYLIGGISKQSLSDSEWYSGYSHLFFKDGDGYEIYRDYDQSEYPSVFFDALMDKYSPELITAYDTNDDTTFFNIIDKLLWNFHDHHFGLRDTGSYLPADAEKPVGIGFNAELVWEQEENGNPMVDQNGDVVVVLVVTAHKNAPLCNQEYQDQGKQYLCPGAKIRKIDFYKVGDPDTPPEVDPRSFGEFIQDELIPRSHNQTDIGEDLISQYNIALRELLAMSAGSDLNIDDDGEKRKYVIEYDYKDYGSHCNAAFMQTGAYTDLDCELIKTSSWSVVIEPEDEESNFIVGKNYNPFYNYVVDYLGLKPFLFNYPYGNFKANFFKIVTVLDTNFGYLRITDSTNTEPGEGDLADAYNDLIAAWKNPSGPEFEHLIVDLRGNGGGNSDTFNPLLWFLYYDGHPPGWQYEVNRWTRSENYSDYNMADSSLLQSTVTMPEGAWTIPDYTLDDKMDADPFYGNVAVLTDEYIMSAAEKPVAELRGKWNSRIIGARTRGASGNPRKFEFEFGSDGSGGPYSTWRVRVPTWISYWNVIVGVPPFPTLLFSIEGFGVRPDEIIHLRIEDVVGNQTPFNKNWPGLPKDPDTVLSRAFAALLFPAFPGLEGKVFQIIIKTQDIVPNTSKRISADFTSDMSGSFDPEEVEVSLGDDVDVDNVSLTYLGPGTWGGNKFHLEFDVFVHADARTGLRDLNIRVEENQLVGAGRINIQGSCVRHVNIHSTTEDPDGLYWESAFNNIKEGIEEAYIASQQEGRNCEVWVTEGTYFVFDSSKDDSIEILPGVEVYGGFSGSEYFKRQRNLKEKETILSGRGGHGSVKQVYHVVTGSDDAVLDGITITGGKADEKIHTLFVSDGWYTEETEIYNHLISSGHHEVTVKGDHEITETTDLSGYDLIIITEFTPCLSAEALQNIEDSQKSVLIVEYGDFTYSYDLGLVDNDWADYVQTATVDVITNEHPVTYPYESEIEVYESTYKSYGVTSDKIAGGVTPLVYGNYSAGEVTVMSDDLRKIAATGIYNADHFSSGGWKLFDGIIDHLVSGIETRSGAGMFNRNASPVVRNCIFRDNVADNDGAGMYNDNSTPTVENCVFTNNTAGDNGGGMYNLDNPASEITNTTFAGNVAANNGGGMFNYNSPVILNNSVIWDNGPDQIASYIADPTVSFSNIAGGHAGVDNIDEPPSFADSLHGDFHLQSISPCIDLADDAVAPETDIEGNERYDMPDAGVTIADMGAYEYLPARFCWKEDVATSDNSAFSSYTLNSKNPAPWEFGEPESGPGSCYSGGGNCWATDLSGNYANNANECLETSPIDLSEYSEGTVAELTFMHWYNFENGYDGANVEAWDGAQWNIIDPQEGYPENSINASGTSVDGERGYSSEGDESTWQMQTFYVQGYGNPDFKVRFCMGSDAYGASSGWYIDDVLIRLYDNACEGGCYGVLFDQNFNADNGDFYIDPEQQLGYSWAWGAPTGGPATGADGNVWATNPTGNYNVPEDSCVRSPIVDMSSCLPWQDVQLRFDHWFRFWHNLLGDTWDGAQVQAWNGIAWQRIDPVDGYPDNIYAPGTTLHGQPGYTDMGSYENWHDQTFNLQEFTNYDFQLRFCMTGDKDPHPGWYIDNISIKGPPTPNPNCQPGMVLYSSDFESDNGGFSDGLWNASNNNTWAYGTATNGPGSCHGGSNCWATNLTANYANCEDSYISKSLDLSACGNGLETVYLVYWHWFEFEENTSGCDPMYYDGYTITWSGDGQAWSQPETSSFISGGFNTNSIEATNSGCPTTPWVDGKPGFEDSSGGWVKVVVPIPAEVMTSDFELRFAAGSDGSANEEGAYIDDLCIAAGDYNICDF